MDFREFPPNSPCVRRRFSKLRLGGRPGPLRQFLRDLLGQLPQLHREGFPVAGGVTWWSIKDVDYVNSSVKILIYYSSIDVLYNFMCTYIICMYIYIYIHISSKDGNSLFLPAVFGHIILAAVSGMLF